MKVIKLKFFQLYLLTFILIAQQTLSVSKCNVPVIRKFTLSGMKYSVYDKMKICGHVHDKCCSVADEIKISKLWQQRTRPIVFQNLDLSVLYMKKITEQFENFARLDPRSLSLKYLVQRKVPYEEQYCKFQESTGTVLSSFQAVAIYRQSLRNSMRRLVDRVYGNNHKGRKLKLLYSDDNPFELSQLENMNKLAIKKSKEKNIKRQRKLFGVQKLLEIIRNMKYIKNQKIDYQAAICSKRTNYFFKDFVVVNDSKSSGCLNLLKKQFNFDNKKFRGYIGKAKAGLTKLAYYKANFYCSLCDAHQQKYFDLTQKKFIFSTHFCKNMLTKNEAVIKFMNVILVEYIDFLFKIVKCFTSSGNSRNNDMTNFLQKYKRRIPFINKCYQSLQNGDQFMKSCWFICQSYKPMEISSFYDGDVAMLKQAYLAVYSAFRKMEEARNTEKEINENPENEQDDSNVDGMLVEPAGPHLTVSNQYFMDEDSREKYLGTNSVAKRLDAYQTEKLRALFTRHGIKDFDAFLKHYQSQFNKKPEFPKGSEHYKKYMKRMKKKFETKLKKIKEDIIKHPHMNKKVLILFKKIFEEQYLNRNKGEKVTPEYRPLRKLKAHKNERILMESQNQIVKQAQILQKKIKNLKLKQEKKIKKQRALREATEAEIQQQQQHPGSPNKKEVKTGNKDDQEKRIPVEPGSQVYQANLSLFDIAEFQLDYQEEGMNLSKFVNLIEFDESVDDIISQKFKKNPVINLDVIDAYLSLRPKTINEFNHMYKDFIMGPEEMTLATKKFTQAKEKRIQAFIEGDQVKINKLNAKISRIQKKAQQEIMNKFEKEEHKKMKQKLKDLKREKIMNSKEIINNHVDQKHFEKNFHGIKDLFVKLFGT